MLWVRPRIASFCHGSQRIIPPTLCFVESVNEPTTSILIIDSRWMVMNSWCSHESIYPNVDNMNWWWCFYVRIPNWANSFWLSWHVWGYDSLCFPNSFSGSVSLPRSPSSNQLARFYSHPRCCSPLHWRSADSCSSFTSLSADQHKALPSHYYDSQVMRQNLCWT